jgi:hypothetical protein
MSDPTAQALIWCACLMMVCGIILLVHAIRQIFRDEREFIPDEQLHRERVTPDFREPS